VINSVMSSSDYL